MLCSSNQVLGNMSSCSLYDISPLNNITLYDRGCCKASAASKDSDQHMCTQPLIRDFLGCRKLRNTGSRLSNEMITVIQNTGTVWVISSMFGETCAHIFLEHFAFFFLFEICFVRSVMTLSPIMPANNCGGANPSTSNYSEYSFHTYGPSGTRTHWGWDLVKYEITFLTTIPRRPLNVHTGNKSQTRMINVRFLFVNWTATWKIGA